SRRRCAPILESDSRPFVWLLSRGVTRPEDDSTVTHTHSPRERPIRTGLELGVEIRPEDRRTYRYQAVSDGSGRRPVMPSRRWRLRTSINPPHSTGLLTWSSQPNLRLSSRCAGIANAVTAMIGRR